MASFLGSSTERINNTVSASLPMTSPMIIHFSFFIILLASCGIDNMTKPNPKKIPYKLIQHNDVRIDNILPFKQTKEEDDEKHVHPLQLDVIDRVVELYSNPNEVILTPFMGVGSEVYSPVSLGRKAIGVELKDSYFKQAKLNLLDAENRFANEIKQHKLI